MFEATASDSSWKAYLELNLRHIADKTRLIPQKRFGPLSVQRPFYPENDLCHLYLLHPPGGIVGGDQLQLNVLAEEGSHSLITAPGANKFYRSAGNQALFNQNFIIKENATLEFLPLENIYFPGAIVNAVTDIHVADHSQFIFWESHCFGRPSIDELFDFGEVKLLINITDSNGLILTEKQRITSEKINSSCVMRGYSVVSSMLTYGHHFTKDEMTQLREVTVNAGYLSITQFTEELLIIRYLGNSTADAQSALRKIWKLLRTKVINRKYCMPRIWNT